MEASRSTSSKALRLVVRAGILISATLFLLAANPPKTRKAPVTDVYHGVGVTDDYRWLEDWNSAEVRAWSQGQNAYARSILDALSFRDAVRARLSELESATAGGYSGLAWRKGKLFALRSQPPREQPFLVMMNSPDEPEPAKVLVNPSALDKNGTTAIDWYVPSPDGNRVAVSLSGMGSEIGDVHVYDAASGREIGEPIPRVNGGTAGGDLAWSADGNGFFYTRYPRGNERPAADMYFYTQVYFHKLGGPTSEDRYEIGRDFPKVAEVQLEGNAGTGQILASVQHGDGGGFSHYLRSSDGAWVRLTRVADQIVQATFGCNQDVYLISQKGAPRGKLLRLTLANPKLEAASTILPEGDSPLEFDFWGPSTVVCSAKRLYAVYQAGGPSEIRVFDHQGRRQASPTLLPVSAVSNLTPLEGEELLFQNASHLDPSAWYRFRADAGVTARTRLETKSPGALAGVEVVREFATSKDGTRVPVNIIRRKGIQLDHTHAALVTGYGGYGINMSPRFSVRNRLLVEQGVVFAEANLRGGGEFGEQWHQQGNLVKKQNVFDDFAAVLQHMIDRGYTSPDKLAITGGSNGGLLMGAMLAQHPDLMKVVVSSVGIYDMLRVELSPNGEFNVPEFGTVKNKEHFTALHAYSPYYHVKEGLGYPAVLFLTGANDPRVDPMQSRKMTARLQAATASGKPVLLRTSAETGHGMGTSLSRRVEQNVDVLAFLFHELGLAYRPVGESRARER